MSGVSRSFASDLLTFWMNGEEAVDTMGQQWKGGIARARSVPVRYRCLFLLATLCGGAFLLMSVNNGAEFLFLTNEPVSAPAWHARHHDLPADDSFTINTEGCTIPGLRAFDESIVKFIQPPRYLKQCPNSNFSLLASNDTHIWVKTDNLPYYHVPSDGNVTCCYKSFYRPTSITNIVSEDVDDRVKYEPCFYFSTYIEVMNEFVGVTCQYEYKTLYEQYFLFAPPKPIITFDDDASTTPQNQSYNVIVLGIDAISRLNFHRTMPKTLAYLKKKGSVELLGYNKVGDNTFPNLTPMLIGIREEDLKKTCWPNMKSTFDNCPFIWDWFKEAGYYTALAEDSATLGTFNFGKLGFTRTPTDYYIHTFMNEAEKHVGNNKDFNSVICMGDKYFYKVLLDYIESLTTTLKSSKLFGFFWEVTMSHDYLNYPMAMDDNFERFLQNLDNSKYLEDTVFILLSDHGIRWGEIRYTKQGRLEERLPLVHILVPPSFRQNYSLAYDNLKFNSRSLTTPFDIHATLSDLVNLDAIQNERIKSRSEEPYAHDRRISLFLPISKNRTCKMAGIEDHWCTCHSSKRLSADSGEAREAAAQLMRHLNKLVKDYRQCARLKLAMVVEVTEMVVGKPDANEDGWREYMVVVRATPGDGVFEATLRRGKRDWTLSGTISRLNLYGSQSRCVHHYQLKLYCYCL